MWRDRLALTASLENKACLSRAELLSCFGVRVECADAFVDEFAAKLAAKKRERRNADGIAEEDSDEYPPLCPRRRCCRVGLFMPLSPLLPRSRLMRLKKGVLKPAVWRLSEL